MGKKKKSSLLPSFCAWSFPVSDNYFFFKKPYAIYSSFPALEEWIMSDGRTLLHALEGAWISDKGRLGANSAVGQNCSR